MDRWELAEVELEGEERLVPAVVRPDGRGLTLEAISALIDLDATDPEAFNLLMDLLEAFLERPRLDAVQG